MSRKKWTSDKLFFRLLNNKSKTTYWENIIELRSRANDEVHLRATQLCKSKIDKEKEIGVDLLAQLGFNPRVKQNETIDVYFELLKYAPSPKLLDNILSGIGHNNEILTDRQIQEIIKYKNHNYSDVRFSLVHALSRLENKHAIKALISLSKDKHHDIRNWATFGLGSQVELINDDIVNALYDRINDSHQETRFEAIVGLANRKDQRTKKIIIKELKTGEYGSLLFEAIEALNDKELLPYLEEILDQVKSETDINKWWLLSLEEAITSLNNEVLQS